jgi:hypothetical protein
MNEIRTISRLGASTRYGRGVRRGLALLLGLAVLLGVASIAEVARAAPRPIAGTTLDGKRLSLADLRGKPVVINVWSSW